MIVKVKVIGDWSYLHDDLVNIIRHKGSGVIILRIAVSIHDLDTAWETQA